MSATKGDAEYTNRCKICDSLVDRDEFGDHVLGHEVQQ